MVRYVIGMKEFETLDEARAYAISRTNRYETYAVDVSKVGEHTYLYVGTVFAKGKKYYWQKSVDLWEINRDGTLSKKMYPR